MKQMEIEQKKPTKDRCKGCDESQTVLTNDGWRFLGCYHKPYKGKWVVEIKDCPQQQSECK